MKKWVSMLMLALLVITLPTLAEDLDSNSQQLEELTGEPEVIPQPIADFIVELSNLPNYSIVALNNADINCHTRGSLYVGGTLTGQQYIDDGAINGVSPSNSYIYDNQSEIVFKSRTSEQDKNAWYQLTDWSIETNSAYWQNILNNFPDNSAFIYVKPDENGFVDLRYWNYHSSGSDSNYQSIPTVYWTDATSVTMGGLAGHLIAPFADINIVSCNYCGSIVGYNIYTDGESHINYWVPDLKYTSTASLQITKYLKTPDNVKVMAQDAVFYVQVFEDSDFLIPVTEPLPLYYENSSASTAFVEELDIDKTYYIAEVDENGNIETGIEGFFSIDYTNGQKIYLDADSSMEFTNVFVDLPDGYYIEEPTSTPIPPTPTLVPTDTPTPAPTATNTPTPEPTFTATPTITAIPFTPEPVSTGDNTNLPLFIVVFIAAGGIIGAALKIKRK